MHSRRLLAVLALAASLAGCAGVEKVLATGFQKPKLTFQSFTPRELDLEGVTLGLVYRIDNPNPIGLPLANVDYKVDVEGRQAVSGSSRTGLHIPASGSAPLELPIRLRYADVPGFLTNLLTKERLGFHVQATAGIQTPVGVIGIPMSYTGEVDRPKLPQIGLAGISLGSASLSGLSFKVRVNVANPNGFALPVGALAYGLKVGGNPVVSAASQGIGSVAGHGKTQLEIPVQLPFAQAADAVNRLMRGGSADVALDGKANFGSMSLPVNLAGKLAR
jgi:LEA14-like dessication related protein